MCDFTRPFFGASYPDAACIDGLLYDLDNCDGDGCVYPSSEEIACPKCATADYLARIRQDAEEDIPQAGSMATPAAVWEAAVTLCLEENPKAALTALSMVRDFSALDWPDRIDAPHRQPDEPDLKDFVWRDWPWDVPGLSAHVRAAIRAAGGRTSG